jgi:predicted DNA-binding transcriptional regulator AlpA
MSPPRPLDEPLLTAAEVAEMTGLSRIYVRQRLRWKADELPCCKVDGSLRWKRADVERWLEGRRGREGEALLTPVEVAAILGLTRVQAYHRLRWKIPCRKIGGSMRFKRGDIERWIEGQHQRGKE